MNEQRYYVRYNVKYCTVQKSGDRMHDSVENGRKGIDNAQYRRLEIECRILYIMEELKQNEKQCTVWQRRNGM